MVVNPFVAAAVTIAASANTVCEGTQVTFTATPTNGGTTPFYQWKVNGEFVGTNSPTHSYIPANGDSIRCIMTSSVPCSQNPATSNTITMTVNPFPVTPTAGTHIFSQTQIIWNWNTVTGATGYKWNATNDLASATDMGTAITKTETGLSCDSSYTRYVWAFDSCGHSIPVVITATTSDCFSNCGQLTINHIAGGVASVSKSVTYNTITGIPGEPSKCWITSNLGSDHQATAVNDATEASAGWYWQFNRKQGYKHDGTNLTPNSTWTSNISENSDWLLVNDPCNLELGTSWRIPTISEWTNIDNAGDWNNWNGPWGSGLKLHAAGYLNPIDGSLSSRGYFGEYWSKTQNNTNLGWFLSFLTGDTYTNESDKTYGFSIRCLKDTCSPLTTPNVGTNVPSQNSIIWNWSTVTGAIGYKWNTTNDSATATDMGNLTTQTETGLLCNTNYTRYVWAYNSCGNSSPVTLTATTTTCSFTCGQTITVNHVTGDVAPVNKTTSYGTVTGIPGEPSKCWITSNLGSDHQATSVDDETEASAGWYWQFNRPQGYKNDGITITPSWSSTTINENSEWMTTNDPCQLELGNIWRIPTYAEWYNVDNIGGWNNWYGPWNSGLKLHAAGYLYNNNGSLSNRGFNSNYWSSAQYGTSNGRYLFFYYNSCMMSAHIKEIGFSVRCIRDSACIIPLTPNQGTNVPSQNSIIWNWGSSPGATGYKWNTINDYASATDLGYLLTKTDTGLMVNVQYTRYVWAYNFCGHSQPLTLTSQTTSNFALGQNFGGGVIFYIDNSGQHGLIAANVDQSNAPWGCYGHPVGNTSGSIGSGQSNTYYILNSCSDAGTASWICSELILNGFDDWYLPSTSELYEMYLQRTLIGNFNPIGFYWSSYEDYAMTSYYISFENGGTGSKSKDETAGVRAIRSF
jgi:hypothetical protein